MKPFFISRFIILATIFNFSIASNLSAQENAQENAKENAKEKNSNINQQHVSNYKNSQSIPPQLQGWEGWVKELKPERYCIKQKCLWFSSISAKKNQSDPKGFEIQFEIENLALTNQKLFLPGDKYRWPTTVLVDNNQVPVSEENSKPYIIIAPQKIHNIKAAYVANDLTLIPTNDLTGLIQIEQALVNNSNGSFSIEKTSALDEQANNKNTKNPEANNKLIELKISHLLTDDTKPIFTTNVTFINSSSKKIINVSNLIAQDAIVINIQGAFVNFNNNILNILVPSGTSSLNIVSVVSSNLKEIKFNPIKTDENVSIDPNTYFALDLTNSKRIVKANQNPIDSSNTHTPKQWRNHPIYQTTNNKIPDFSWTDKFQENKPEFISNKMEVFLNLDKNGYFIEQISDLNIKEPIISTGNKLQKLQNVSLNAQDIPIFLDQNNNETISLPYAHKLKLKLSAISNDLSNSFSISIPTSLTEINNAILKNTNVTLNLSGGWKILAASGTVKQIGFFDAFNLFDIFYIIILLWMTCYVLSIKAAIVLAFATITGKLFAGALFYSIFPVMLLALALKSISSLNDDNKIKIKFNDYLKIALFSTSVFFTIVFWLPFAINRVSVIIHPSMDTLAQPNTTSFYSYNNNDPTFTILNLNQAPGFLNLITESGVGAINGFSLIFGSLLSFIAIFFILKAIWLLIKNKSGKDFIKNSMYSLGIFLLIGMMSGIGNLIGRGGSAHLGNPQEMAMQEHYQLDEPQAPMPATAAPHAAVKENEKKEIAVRHKSVDTNQNAINSINNSMNSGFAGNSPNIKNQKLKDFKIEQSQVNTTPPQAGIAKPRWRHNYHVFSISEANKQAEVFLLPPVLSRILGFICAFLLGFFIYLVNKKFNTFYEFKNQISFKKNEGQNEQNI